MIGLTLLIVSPNYPWYALMLLPFIVLSGRWEYVAVILALDVTATWFPAVPPYSEAVSLLAACLPRRPAVARPEHGGGSPVRPLP